MLIIGLLALVPHIIFMVLFRFIGVRFMFYFNLGSALIYILCMTMYPKGKHRIVVAVSTVEVLLNCGAAVVYLGWDSGFAHFIILLAVIALHSRPTVTPKSIVQAAVFGVLYLHLRLYCRIAAPLVRLDRSFLGMIEVMNIFFFFAALITTICFSRWFVFCAERGRTRSRRRFETICPTDELTKLLNRTTMLERLDTAARTARDTGRGYTLVMTEIDDFKHYIDMYGRGCGDALLCETAGIFKASVRSGDCVSRWNGEKFLILLVDTDREIGLQLTERIRKSVCDHVFPYEDLRIRLTMTFGITVCDGWYDITHEIRESDRALRDGKRKGKNCICVA
jgi:diguanylate cyclase (GGDEF)-like protein